MAYNVSSGALLEMVFQYEVSGQQCLNILHYVLELTGTPLPGPTTLNEVLTEWIDGASPTKLEVFAAAMCDTVEFRKLSAQWIYPVRYRKDVRTLDQTGDLVEINAPAVNAVVITKANDFTGPHNLGALHLAGFPRGWLLSDGRIDETAIAGPINDVAQMLLETMSVGSMTGTLSPVIFNRASPADSRPFTTWEIQETARAMQRRVVGRGI